jgi:hypothetical protein
MYFIIHDITLLLHVAGNAESFICRWAPHFSTVSAWFVRYSKK